MPSEPPQAWLEAMAIGMLNAYGVNLIEEEAPSMGRDLRTRKAIENRMIEARGAYKALWKTILMEKEYG